MGAPAGALNPCRRILEVGCYEGAGTTWLIKRLGSEGELHCIDAWLDAPEHVGHDMGAIEKRWRQNVDVTLKSGDAMPKIVVHKGLSDLMLSTLLARGMRNYFDLVYVDASHLATNVLCDAVLAFRLTRPGGFLFFDDYLWDPPGVRDPLQSPKPAVDAFVNLYYRQLRVLGEPGGQLYTQKIGD